MSKLLIDEDANGHFTVWITLPDHDPIQDAFGFVIGVGATRAEAVADAVVDLEAALEELQAAPGVIEERSGRGVAEPDGEPDLPF